MLLLHCLGWIAHQRKAKRTVSFLKLLSACMFILLSSIVIIAKALLLLSWGIWQPSNKCLLVYCAEKNECSLLQLQPDSTAENTEVKFVNSSWCCLTKFSQWLTSNWRNSQRWLSPRAAAHASTPHPYLACLLPTNSLSLSGHSLHPWRTAIVMEDPSFHFPFSTQWLFRVSVWMCITVLKQFIWGKKWFKS